MKIWNLSKALLIGCFFLAGFVFAEPIPVQKPSSEADIGAVLTGGVPMGRWKEGLLFEGVRPMPWLKSAANWFPGTEEVQPDEMRVTFMGTAPNIRPGQMNTSIYVELGNGDNFVFDMGEGAVANYVAARVALNQLKTILLPTCTWITLARYPISTCSAPGPVAGMKT